MTDLIPNDLGHFEGNEVPDDFTFENHDMDYPEPRHSYNGACPRCGGYTDTIGGNYDDDPMQDVCYNCGWESDWMYD
jgi:hypothetical protein